MQICIFAWVPVRKKVFIKRPRDENVFDVEIVGQKLY